jgi:hypothetical protein
MVRNMMPVTQSPLEWIALTPERVEGSHAPGFQEILNAFDKFKAEYEKDQQTSTWLKEHALDGWPHSITWVCWDRATGRVDGFFTVGKTRVDHFDLGDALLQLSPASKIENLRRDVHARVSEDELVKRAVFLATAPWKEVGADAVVVLLDPSGAKLHRNHDFWFETADKKYLWARFILEKDGPKPQKSTP